MGVIAIGKIGFFDGPGATNAFGDILPGHLQMHTARMGAFGPVHIEEGFDLAQDKIEGGASCSPRRP